jgi:hypothetical protein
VLHLHPNGLSIYRASTIMLTACTQRQMKPPANSLCELGEMYRAERCEPAAFRGKLSCARVAAKSPELASGALLLRLGDGFHETSVMELMI